MGAVDARIRNWFWQTNLFDRITEQWSFSSSGGSSVCCGQTNLVDRITEE